MFTVYPHKSSLTSLTITIQQGKQGENICMACKLLYVRTKTCVTTLCTFSKFYQHATFLYRVTVLSLRLHIDAGHTEIMAIT
jgi:hypothetical protein